MTRKSSPFIKLLFFIVLLSTTTLNAQILRDSTSMNLVKEGVDYVYNYEFKNAKDIIKKISLTYPEHPVGYLLKGMVTYWENFPLLADSEESVVYERDLKICIEICEKPHNQIDEAEYLLANLCARGMLMLFYSDNSISMEIIKLAPGTYPLIRKSFDFTSSYADFYYFTGLYNYYREAYPDAYPVYKTLAFLFPGGDKEMGLKELKLATESAIVLKAESFLFLSGISTSFEKDYYLASTYTKSLHELYPANMQYLSMYIKNLLLIKNYDEAERHLNNVRMQRANAYFQAQAVIYNGIVQEKKYKNYSIAQQYYYTGARDMISFENMGNEFIAYAYFGLSRISEINGDKNYAGLYRRQALDRASFKDITFDD